MTAKIITVRVTQFGDEGWFFAHSDDDDRLKLCAPTFDEMNDLIPEAVEMLSPDLSFRIKNDDAVAQLAVLNA